MATYNESSGADDALLLQLPTELLLCIIRATALVDIHSACALMNSNSLLRQAWNRGRRCNMSLLMGQMVGQEVLPAALLYLESSRFPTVESLLADDAAGTTARLEGQEDAPRDPSAVIGDRIRSWNARDHGVLPLGFSFRDAHRIQLLERAIDVLAPVCIAEGLDADYALHEPGGQYAHAGPSQTEMDRVRRALYIHEHFRSVGRLIERGFPFSPHETTSVEYLAYMDGPRMTLPSGFSPTELHQMQVVVIWLSHLLHGILSRNIAAYRERRCCHEGPPGFWSLYRSQRRVSAHRPCIAVHVLVWETSLPVLADAVATDADRYPFLIGRPMPASMERSITQTSGFSPYAHWLPHLLPLVLSVGRDPGDEGEMEGPGVDAGDDANLFGPWPVDLIDFMWGYTTGEHLTSLLEFLEQQRLESEAEFPLTMDRVQVAVIGQQPNPGIPSTDLCRLFRMDAQFPTLPDSAHWNHQLMEFPFDRFPEWSYRAYVVEDDDPRRLLPYQKRPVGDARFHDAEGGPLDMFRVRHKLLSMPEEFRHGLEDIPMSWPLYDRGRSDSFVPELLSRLV